MDRTDQEMHLLDEALDREIHGLDTVLLRLTTLRLLMVTGKHQLVDRAAAELDQAMSDHEQAEEAAVGALERDGFHSLDDAVQARPPEERAALERRASTLRAMHRDVRVALATTGATAERSTRLAASQIQGASPLPAPRRRAMNPFLMGD